MVFVMGRQGRRLFKGVCPKKKKKRGKRAKKDKVSEGKPCTSFSANYKEWQRGDAEKSKSNGQVASDANRDFDLNAKVTFAKKYICLLQCCSFTSDQHIFCPKKYDDDNDGMRAFATVLKNLVLRIERKTNIFYCSLTKMWSPSLTPCTNLISTSHNRRGKKSTWLFPHCG